MEINFASATSLKRLMKEYADTTEPLSGQNSEGEDMRISVTADSVMVRTYQNNGWMRIDEYKLDEGEIIHAQTFDGRWDR